MATTAASPLRALLLPSAPGDPNRPPVRSVRRTCKSYLCTSISSSPSLAICQEESTMERQSPYPPNYFPPQPGQVQGSPLPAWARTFRIVVLVGAGLLLHLLLLFWAGASGSANMYSAGGRKRFTNRHLARLGDDLADNPVRDRQHHLRCTLGQQIARQGTPPVLGDYLDPGCWAGCCCLTRSGPDSADHCRPQHFVRF
jgi:hypothetical protein